MAKFNLENYETVEERLKKFWNDYPNGRVETEVVHITDDGTCVTIKSAIYKDINDVHPVATGIAQETKGQGGFANADAWMENCETSSLGRSLSNWMYQGANKPRPSREEMSKSVKNEVQVEKKTTPKLTKEELEKMEEVVKEMTSDTKPIADQINEILFGGGYAQLEDKKIKEYKKAAYNTCIDSGFPADVNDWNNNQMSIFFETFDLFCNNSDDDIVKEVFGEVAELKVCPECKKSDYIEDNREKKASDTKYSKIPDFACSNYGESHGCGKGWYIGNEDLPSGWI